MPERQRLPDRASQTFDDGDGLPEIRVEAYDKIDHWRDRLDQTAKLEKRNVFERAAADLFLEAEYQRDLGAVQAIYDATYVLGRDHAALSDDDIQFVMVGAEARAKRESERHTNGSEEPPQVSDESEFTGAADTKPEQTAAPIGNIPLSVEDWLARVLPDLDRIIGEWFFTTSRTLLIGPTGVGKTNFSMAIAGHSAIGRNFLHWRAHRPSRILYIDGEMSARLFKQRLADLVRRLGEIPKTLFPFSHEDIENFAPLNTAAGVAILNRLINKVGGVDGIVFDNIMSLIAGDMKEEEGWRQTLPLVTSLTKRGIAQVWLHHTGHDETRGYGTKTREWRMDNVIHLTTEERPDTDVSFRLEFRKARTRTPETRRDFQDATIALVNDEWMVQAPATPVPSAVSPIGQKFLDALHNALAGDMTETRYGRRAVTLELWKAECFAIGLLDRDKPANQVRALWSKYRLELIAANRIACDDKLAWTIT
jgi:hypothetical protein